MCMRVRKKIPRNQNYSFKGKRKGMRRNDLKRKRQRDAIEGKAGDITLWAGNTHSGWQLDNTLNVNKCVHQRLGGEKQRGGWKEKCGERKALGAEYLESHTCVSHTPTCTHICWNRDKLLVRFCCLRAFFAKWSLCPHENLWHFIPAEKWAGRRFDHESASSHSSQSASALRKTEFVLFDLGWRNAGAIGMDLDCVYWVLVRDVCCFVSLDAVRVFCTLYGVLACRLFNKQNLSVTRLEQQGKLQLCKQEMESN